MFYLLSCEIIECLLLFFISFLLIHLLSPPLPLPLQDLSDAPFYSDEDGGSDEDEEEDSDEDEDGEGKKKKKSPKKKPYVMDSDHRLLLRNCKPLLQSRNASVSWLSKYM